eukprot:m.33531 g.33531  ORF g.33531 m.33531 type:complete len:174 (-) comp5618_c0_seq2:136-657(-)
MCSPGFVRAKAFGQPMINCIVAHELVYNYPIHCQGTFQEANYQLVPGSQCTPSSSFTEKYLTPNDIKCPHQEWHSKPKSSAGAAIGLTVAFVLVAIVVAVLALSPKARSLLVRQVGTDGAIGGLLSSCSCFRSKKSFVYSELGSGFPDDNEKDEDDDDTMLFGVDDSEPTLIA